MITANVVVMRLATRPLLGALDAFAARARPWSDEVEREFSRVRRALYTLAFASTLPLGASATFEHSLRRLRALAARVVEEREERRRGGERAPAVPVEMRRTG